MMGHVCLVDFVLVNRVTVVGPRHKEMLYHKDSKTNFFNKF